MNCNCVSEIKDRLAKELPMKNAEYANLKIDSVSMDGECFIYSGNKLIDSLSMPITIKHQPVGRKTKTTTNILFSYCPFCGVSYAEDGGEHNG